MTRRRTWLKTVTLCLSFVGALLLAVSSGQSPFGGRPGGGGGPGQPDKEIVKDYDHDDDGILNAAERKVARKALEQQASARGPGRRGPGRRGGMEPGTPGPKVAITDATTYPDATFYDPKVLRTLFLDFQNEDWEQELATFKPTDVEVPAKLTVDGKEYDSVGVSFRGASSFFMIPEGLKRSLNISIDFVDEDQRLYGYKSLNLLNCNGDSSMMSSILYSHFAGERIATPKVNYVKVVINGESWGLYVSSQQFNKTFVKENFDTEKGARWKVSGSPRGDGGLRYLGDNIEPYRQRYEIKSKDKESSWKDLINLCQVLNETPANQLEQKLSPILDIQGALWFLAVDCALVNSDGYWTRASDYNIYQDKDGKFHILPHDMNEALSAGQRGGPGRGGPGGGGSGRGGPGGRDGDRDGRDRGRGVGDRRGPPRGADGPGFDVGRLFGGGRRGGPGGPGGGGAHGSVELDPLTNADPERMPLRDKLLSNPKWQREYLENIRTIAEQLKWENLGPIVEQHRELIEAEVARDTRKLFSTEEFATTHKSTLRDFCEQRSEFLLNHAKVKSLGSK